MEKVIGFRGRQFQKILDLNFGDACQKPKYLKNLASNPWFETYKQKESLIKEGFSQ